MRNFITTSETRNATPIPRRRVISSADVNAKPNLRSFIALKPSITGTARKNVNSAAAVRDTPIISAPMMVAPEREVPGMIERT